MKKVFEQPIEISQYLVQWVCCELLNNIYEASVMFSALYARHLSVDKIESSFVLMDLFCGRKRFKVNKFSRVKWSEDIDQVTGGDVLQGMPQWGDRHMGCNKENPSQPSRGRVSLAEGAASSKDLGQ